MEFILDSKQLLEKLQYLSNVLPTSSTLPIINNFLFQSKEGALQITASDLDNTLITKLQFEGVVSNDVNIAIPAKILIDILKTLPHQPLSFVANENNTLDIVSGSGNYTIAYHNGNEYPTLKIIENASSVMIKSDVLVNAINKTLFAVGTDDLRPIMTGVLCEFMKDKINFVATDAHKLVVVSRNDIVCEEEVSMIIPRKPLNVLKTILNSNPEPVAIEYNQSNAKMTFGDYELLIRLIEGKYPAYDRVIPKENPNKLIINRIEFLKSLKRISILSSRDTHQVKLSLKGQELELSSEDKDYSKKGDEKLSCNYHGNDMEIGFNSHFLSEMLSVLDTEEIEMELSEPYRAGVIFPRGDNSEESVLMLVMPTLIQ